MGFATSQVYKICILGLEQSGKTLLCSLMKPQQKIFYTDAFSYFLHPVQDGVDFEVWDQKGKHPHLWNHHFNGVNGFIFVIDQLRADEPDGDYLTRSVKELLNICANKFDIGLAIIVNEHRSHQPVNHLTKEWFQ